MGMKHVGDAAAWAEETFGSAALGDARRIRRLVRAWACSHGNLDVAGSESTPAASQAASGEVPPHADGQCRRSPGGGTPAQRRALGLDALHHRAGRDPGADHDGPLATTGPGGASKSSTRRGRPAPESSGSDFSMPTTCSAWRRSWLSSPSDFCNCASWLTLVWKSPWTRYCALSSGRSCGSPSKKTRHSPKAFKPLGARGPRATGRMVGHQTHRPRRVGWKTLWEGWTKLQQRVEEYEAATLLRGASGT